MGERLREVPELLAARTDLLRHRLHGDRRALIVYARRCAGAATSDARVRRPGRETDIPGESTPVSPITCLRAGSFNLAPVNFVTNAARYSDEVLHLGTYPPLGGLQSMMEPSATVADPEENVCPC